MTKKLIDFSHLKNINSRFYENVLSFDWRYKSLIDQEKPKYFCLEYALQFFKEFNQDVKKYNLDLNILYDGNHIIVSAFGVNFDLEETHTDISKFLPLDKYGYTHLWNSFKIESMAYIHQVAFKNYFEFKGWGVDKIPEPANKPLPREKLKFKPSIRTDTFYLNDEVVLLRDWVVYNKNIDDPRFRGDLYLKKGDVFVSLEKMQIRSIGLLKVFFKKEGLALRIPHNIIKKV